MNSESSHGDMRKAQVLRFRVLNMVQKRSKIPTFPVVVAAALNVVFAGFVMIFVLVIEYIQ